MKELQNAPLDNELQKSYIDYAMSVIIGRAIPEARDGLKPVQRRILYAMYLLKNFHNLPTKKSARVTGEAMGKFHPHGDIAIYDALVRMAQPFSMHHLLVEGQGNFGCFTKDTKIKLTDGRDIDFEHLIKEQADGNRHWTFTFNPTTSSIEVTEIKNPRVTRRNAELIEVTIDDGNKIRCTPDHRFLLRDGDYREAKDLKPGDSLMPAYTKTYNGANDKNLKDYDMIYQPQKVKWQFIHHLSDEWNINEGIYAKSRGRVRHHLDINKKNNNPNNIQRLDWKEHWQLHHDLASWRHKHDPLYVKKLAEGRNKYIRENHQKISKHISELNKNNWKKPSYRKKHSQMISALWQNPEYRKQMQTLSSNRLKAKWTDKEFRENISALKSKELKKRWESETYRERMRNVTKQVSLKLWRNPQHREHISRVMKKLYNTPEQIKYLSERSKTLWKDPEYKNKFTREHFSKIAKKAWTDEKYALKQSDRTKKQWQNPEFRNKIINRTRESDLRRMKENPQYMSNLAKAAKIVLHKKWQNPEYKKQVMKSKILGYVSALNSKYHEVTPIIYESERKNNGIPKIERALRYFSNFEQITREAKIYNHKVISIAMLLQIEDVYDITVAPWHNFSLAAGIFVHNSIDGDPPAAMRYTEVRMTKLSEEILDDLEKETVDFVPNFDNTEQEPLILPSKIPNLLVNGASGIAVGVATSMPPHNMNEVCDAIAYALDHNETNVEDVLGIIKGPDFPTGGIAIMSQNAYNGYRHGRGQTTVRAKAEIDEKKKKIIIHEIPYNVNKATMIQTIVELVREKQITGIKDLKDQSDRKGIHIVIDLKEDANPEQVLNVLYKHTQLEITFPIINLAVVGKSLRSLNVLQMITTFIDFRKEIIIKRSQHDLTVAKDRLHIVQGLLIAIDKIEEIIKDIKASGEISQARSKLITVYTLSEKQANAILDMKLSRLTHLESNSLNNEAAELEKSVAYHTSVIAEPERVKGIIKEETLAIKKQYGKPRQTEILNIDEPIDIKEEDMISNDKVTVIMTNAGYVKRQNITTFKEQGRGGRGVIAINLKEGDYVKEILACNNKDYILCISNAGRAYWIKAYNIPESSRYSEGKAIVNLLNIKDEKIVVMLNIKNAEKANISFLTAKGIVKKTDAILFSHPRSNGVRAINLRPGDEISNVIIHSNDKYLTILTKRGKAIKFEEADLRQIGRTASGVRGIRIKGEDMAKDIISASDVGSILTVTEKGYGKLTDITKYRTQGRGGSGVINIKTSEKTGPVAKALFVSGEQQVILINSKGISITIPIDSIRITGRAASGVRLMKLEEGSKVVDARVIKSDEVNQQPTVVAQPPAPPN